MKLKFALAKSASGRYKAVAASKREHVFDFSGVVGYDVTQRDVSEFLAASGDADVTIRVNSPGGDVFEGTAIHNLLKSHKGSVTVEVVGIAASAASIVAMAASPGKLYFYDSAFLMIHNAWSYLVGNRNDFTEAAGVMAKLDATMAGIYAKRADSANVAAFSALMDAETWFTAAEAVDAGLADGVLDAEVEEADDGEQAKLSARVVDYALSCVGYSRTERRQMLSELKKPVLKLSAEAENDTLRAIEEFKNSLNSIFKGA